jgi:hypothetical protein
MNKFRAPIHYSNVVDIMKIHNAHLQFGLCLAACMPLPSHAGMEVPYWLYPEWIAAKVMDFHARNSERYEQAQILAQAKSTTTPSAASNTNSVMTITATTASAVTVGTTATTMNIESSVRKTNLAPVETATAKVNEKYLTKEELIELRKQLRQK